MSCVGWEGDLRAGQCQGERGGVLRGEEGLVKVGEDDQQLEMDDDEELLGGESWRHMMGTLKGASISSAVSVSVAQPIDVASQIARRNNAGILQAMAKVATDSGVRGLFKGNQFQILRKVPTKAVFVVTHEWCNKLLRVVRRRSSHALPHVVDNVAVSSFAAAFSVAVTYPLHALQVMTSRGLTVRSLKPIYRGVTPLCLATAPAVAVELFAYNVIRDSHPNLESNVAALLSLSMLTRLATQTLAYPFKLVSKDLVSSTTMSGMRSAATRIVQESGPLGLFQGVKYKYLKIVVSVMAAQIVQQRLQSPTSEPVRHRADRHSA